MIALVAAIAFAAAGSLGPAIQSKLQDTAAGVAAAGGAGPAGPSSP